MDREELVQAMRRGRRARPNDAGDRFRFAKEAAAWCEGRNAWVRLPFMVYGLHVLLLAMLSFRNPEPRSIFSPIFSFVDFGFDWLNLGIHEIGHIIFQPLGMFMSVLGGSLIQCLVPALSTIMFYRQRDFFGIAFCFLWFGMNLMDVAVYVADARAMALQLVSPFGGGHIIHDWNWLLTKTGLLQADKFLAFVIRVFALLSVSTFLAAGGWLLWRMFHSKKPEPEIELD